MMVNQTILYGVGDFFLGGNLAVANPVDFCEMLVPSNLFFSQTFQGRSTVIHVPRGVVVRELNETKALELKDLDKVPLGGREVKDDMVAKGKLVGVFGARFLWRVFFSFFFFFGF